MIGLPFLSGLVLGLSLIIPIGAQNIFVLNQGLLGGIRRGMIAAVVTGVCDTTLILVGAAGLSSVLVGVPFFRTALLWVGVTLLTYVALGLFRSSSQAPRDTDAIASRDDGRRRRAGGTTRSVVLTGVGVSWGNPHAILDTVAILGAAIAAQQAVYRTAFAAGTVTASWVFFFTLALVGALLGKRVTPSTEVWINRVSGAVMLIFAVVLAKEALSG